MCSRHQNIQIVDHLNSLKKNFQLLNEKKIITESKESYYKQFFDLSQSPFTDTEEYNYLPRTAGSGVFLFLFTTVNFSRTLGNLFRFMYVRYIPRIFNHDACN